MARTQVTLRENVDQHALEAVTEDGTVAGWLDYVRIGGGVLVAVHTEVDPAFEGQGIGGQIAEGVVALVRETGEKLRPDCEFIQAWLARHPEAEDVVVRA